MDAIMGLLGGGGSSSGDSGDSGAWSFTDWQCGMGVVDSCKNQKVDWDEPRSW